MKDQGYGIEDQGFLEGCWRQYKVKKIHFKFIWVLIRKNDRKRDENVRNRTWGTALGALHLWQHSLMPKAPLHVPQAPRCG